MARQQAHNQTRVSSRPACGSDPKINMHLVLITLVGPNSVNCLMMHEHGLSRLSSDSNHLWNVIQILLFHAFTPCRGVIELLESLCHLVVAPWGNEKVPSIIPTCCRAIEQNTKQCRIIAQLLAFWILSGVWLIDVRNFC